MFWELEGSAYFTTALGACGGVLILACTEFSSMLIFRSLGVACRVLPGSPGCEPAPPFAGGIFLSNYSLLKQYNYIPELTGTY